MSYKEELFNALAFLKEKVNRKPEIGIILGSGLGELGDLAKDPVIISYMDIPGFPASTVKGHRGNLIFGKLRGKDVVMMQGRFHLYEGYPVNKVAFGVRVLGLLGINTLIVSNAAGGINEDLRPGDLMVIKDHINFTGENPAIGEEIDELGPRFFDMTVAYDEKLRRMARQVFEDSGEKFKEGVYAFFKGPSYETPAEIKMLKILGADAVGMSTVPEVIAARQMGIRVFGVSLITNMAAGINKEPLSHEEVLDISKKAGRKFIDIILRFIERIH